MKSIWLVGLIAVIPGTVVAQEAAQTNNEIEEVVVQAHPLSAEGLAQAAVVLEGDALTRNASSSIAETLARHPCVDN